MPDVSTAADPRHAHDAGGLSVFTNPASVTVVGASANSAKWGYWLASGALQGLDRREVFLVNRGGEPILGVQTYRSVDDVPRLDLVALCVPPAHAESVIDAALARGARGFVGVTAGIPGERAIAARIRASGARLLGANSLGIADTSEDLYLAWGGFTPGPLAIVSQSGQLASEISLLAARAGIGVSRFISVGNQSDVTAREMLEDLVNHPQTRAVALYLESFPDGRALFGALRRLREAGKAVFVLTIGASAASAVLARSHTGSLTTSADVVDAACRAYGVTRSATPSALVDGVVAALTAPAMRGHRVAIVGDSGGQGGIAADVAAASGLATPHLSPRTAESIGRLLPPAAATANPVDLAGAGEQDLATYGKVTDALLRSGEIDGVVLTGYFGRYGADVAALESAEVAQAAVIGAVSARAGLPVIVHSMDPDSAASARLRESGVPVYGSIESALRAAATLAPLPTRDVDEAHTPAIDVPFRPGYGAAREILAAADIRFPGGLIVRDAADLARAARELRAPYVLKAGWLEHKSEASGVVVGIAGVDELTDVFEEMSARLGPGEYVVEELHRRPYAVEILVGMRLDPDLGPVLVVGAGGVETEVLDDVTVELAPVCEDTAREMLDRLRCAKLLQGWRGRPPVDIDGLAALIARVSHLLPTSGATFAEIELNPVLVDPDGCVAVDALIVPRHADASPSLHTIHD